MYIGTSLQLYLRAICTGIVVVCASLLKKDILVFNINSKKTIYLVSVKKDLKTSDIESLGAKFHSHINYDKNDNYFIDTMPHSDTGNYNKEYQKRVINGELLNKDSIKVVDSLQFKTPKGKIVYGGGGIIPDEFVATNKKKIGYKLP